ncbi:MAG: leucine--tRNA ligase [Planctomycetota bacterium]|nr:leucine--tRNA ligase [Planctomycetota bacterium]
MPRYNPAEIEPRWQRYWDENKTFQTPQKVSDDKVYILDMFPYPSGSGLHVGHPEGYTATDIVARYSRMLGKSVLHPMGYDAFGLPAEEYAIKTNTPPRESTEANISTFRRQLKMLGFSYDWDRELATTDVEYFRWTQWIFLVLFDTWFDEQSQKGRPIEELPIPEAIEAAGPEAVATYRDEHRLAYQSDALVNWCPALGTVLANEEVIDGRSERGSHPVQRIPLRQWMLRITSYADRLGDDLESVNWPEGIKKLQRDWIGRSTGAEIDFFVGSQDDALRWQQDRRTEGFPRKAANSEIRVYTTRPDTLYGATYMVIAPEHPLVATLTTPDQSAAVEKYCSEAAFKSDRDRQDDKTKKTGVFTGSYAINPATQEPIPIWIADYVLVSYGTGAIMAVPAHDTRDFQFAETFGLPIIPVYQPADSADVDPASVLKGEICYTGSGTAIHSGPYDGLETEPFKQRIIADMVAAGWGREAVNYKLRDWLFSRQRFWGEPFPILHELDENGNKTGMIRAVDPSELPVDLPVIEDFRPHGRPEPPLEKADDDWLYPVVDGRRYKRETNTMPQWAGSCWYYLRFIDPQNDQAFIDAELERKWMPVDLYIGGAEHAVLHLLYSRFWHKVLYDRGYLSCPEPFGQLVNQGMILGEMEFTGYRNADEQWVSSAVVETNEERQPVSKEDGSPLQIVKLDSDQTEKRGDFFVLKSSPEIRIDSRAHKMSKARGNVVNPDEVVADYGADALRLYEMFMGPLEQSKPWSMAGVSGVRNFLDRVWRMVINERAEENELNAAISDAEPTAEQLRVLHKTIKAVTEDIKTLSFNTAIARMMEFVNFFTKESDRPRSVMEPFLLILSPFAPHLSEELWLRLGNDQTLAYEKWPAFDVSLITEQSIEIPVQLKGKVRARIQVPRGLTQADLETAARSDERVSQLLEGKQVRKVIVVPDRLVNFVVSD